MKSGTQAPPGLYVGNVVFVYPTDAIKDNRGNDITLPGQLTTTANIILVNIVGNQKLLGGNIGASVAFPWIKNRLQANSFDVDTGFGYTDMFAGVNTRLAPEARRCHRRLQLVHADRHVHRDGNEQHGFRHVG
jgi:hypothetical protein